MTITLSFMTNVSSYNFEPFICADNEKYFEDIDPDQQFFNKVCIICTYYTVNKFQQNVRKALRFQPDTFYIVAVFEMNFEHSS